MSLMNWHLTPGGVQVMTDTLATDVDGAPAKFVAKVVAIPHLDLIIGCTGYHEMILGWQHLLMSAAAGLSIDDLDEMATCVLPILWSDLFPEGAGDRLTSMRHWGWSPREERFVGRVYRSWEGFTPLALPDEPCAGFQPKPLPEHLGTHTTFDELVEVAMGQQQAGLAEAPPTHVGGDLLVFEMSKADGEPVLTTIRKAGRFADYERDLAGVREHLGWPES
ncbi:MULTISPECIES: hypothetical protein [unclassified Brevundimonas]|uniref:hypothetical protein n=1 Tax=unclassified Brevundimonas TaxID=2622653 RepID=UPI0025C4A9CF|nr:MULTISPECIES: hypothetical protein [unclassified Brevundimonas]